MGGFGSGRSAGLGRDTVESTRSIDVNRLHREGCLRPGWCGGWQRTRDGEKVATINLRAEEDRLRLSYRVSWGNLDHLSDITDFWGDVRAEAGVRDVRPHDLRHTYASIALMHGETVLTIGRLLGHDHPGTTLKYTNFADAAAREAVDTVSSVLRRV